MASKAPNIGISQQKYTSIFPVAIATVAFTGTSGQSAAFSANVSIARFYSTEDCFLVFGANPTATSSGIFFPGGIVEYYGVVPGQKVAVIRSVTSGNLHIVEGLAE